jgi:hypothetical protein
MALIKELISPTAREEKCQLKTMLNNIYWTVNFEFIVVFKYIPVFCFFVKGFTSAKYSIFPSYFTTNQKEIL